MNRSPRLVALLLLVLGLGLSACSGAGSGETSSAGSVSADAEVAQTGRAADTLSFAAAPRDASGGAVGNAETQPAVISTGSLTVRSDDVTSARDELDRLVDSLGGSVADERTTAGEDGGLRRSRLELRVPSPRFDAAMTGLAGLGELIESTRSAEDVTGEVIDTRARVRAQEQSLARVEVLFERAEDIRDVVAIEKQLSRRQADLDSLRGRLAYLEDQTSLATITLVLEQAPEDVTPVEDDDLAFVAGLKSGWQALGELGGGLATATGALLPFSLVVLVLGAPAVLLVRRRARRTASARA